MTPQPPRFTSGYDTRGLPDSVRAVALACRPDDPQALTQREFDAGRERVPEHAAAPTARQICTRLGVPWLSLLQMLFEPGRDQARTLGIRQGEAEDHELSVRRVVSALLVVAARREAGTLRPQEYEQERQDLLARAARKHRHGAKLDLPTVGQIERVTGGWDGALRAAGLAARPVASHDSASVVTYHEAIRRFLTTQGAMPTSDRLAAFARVQGFPLSRKPPGGHPEALRAVHEEVIAQGGWAPVGPPGLRQHPPYDYAATSTRKAGERRKEKHRPKDECIAGIVAYLEQLRADEKAAQKKYGAWRSGTQHPAPSSFAQYGGWTQLLIEARAARRAAVID